MKTINSYLTEKLRINKNTEVNVNVPETREEFIDFINKYFKEWWDSDSPISIKTSFKNYKNTYDYIMSYLTNEKKFNEKGVPGIFASVLPLKFVKYMNTKYNLEYKLKPEDI